MGGPAPGKRSQQCWLDSPVVAGIKVLKVIEELPHILIEELR